MPDLSIVAAVLLTAACAGLLARIVLLLRADRHDHLARVVAVIRRPAPPPVCPWPDRPLVNPRFAAHIAASSARFAATHWARRHRPHQRIAIGFDLSATGDTALVGVSLDDGTVFLLAAARRTRPAPRMGAPS